MVQLVVDRDRGAAAPLVVSPAVMQDLDRSLRATLLSIATQEENETQAGGGLDVSSSMQAVERAATLMSSMEHRLRELTSTVEAKKVENAKLKRERDHHAAECGALLTKLEAEKAKLAKAAADIDALNALIGKAFGSPETKTKGSVARLCA